MDGWIGTIGRCGAHALLQIGNFFLLIFVLDVEELPFIYLCDAID